MQFIVFLSLLLVIKNPIDSLQAVEALFVREQYKEAIKGYEKLVKYEDTAPEALFRIAECYYNLKEYEKAVQFFEYIIKDYKGYYLCPEALYSLGMCWLTLGDIKAAKHYLIDEIDKFPGYTKEKRVLNGRGMVLFAEGKYKDALIYLKPLRTKEGLYYKAKCYAGLGNPLEALQIYKELVNKYPGTKLAEYAFYSMGDALFESPPQADYAGAIRKYEDFLKLYPWSELKGYARYKLGCSYLHEGEYEKAITCFHFGIQSHDPWLTAHAYYQLGTALLLVERSQEAIEAYQRVKTDYPDMRVAALANIKYGQTYLTRDDTLGAQISFQQVASIYPTGSFAGLGDYLAGTNEFAQGKYIEAIEHYQRVLKLFPGSEVLIPSYTMMLFCYNQMGSYSEGAATGISFYKLLEGKSALRRQSYEASATSGGKKGIWVGRAKLFLAELYYYLDRHQKAKDLYDEVLTSYPFLELKALAYIGKAWCILEEGRYDVAHQMLKEAYERWSADTSLALSSIYGRGIASFNKRDFEDAYQCFLFGIGESYSESELAGDAFYHGGKALAAVGKYANAIEYWEKVLSDYPDCASASIAAFELGRTYYLAGDYEKAINYYKLILNQYPYSRTARDAQFQIGSTYYTAGNFKDAIQEFQKVIDLYPEDPLAGQAKDQVEISYYRWGQENPEILKQFVELHSDADLAADAQWEIAAQLYNDEDYEGAIKEFRKLIVDFPKSERAAESQFFIISAYGALQDYEKRIEACKKFIEYFPDAEQVSEVYFNLGATYFNLAKYEEAIKAFQEIIDKYPDSEHYREAGYFLGACYKNLGEKDKGERLMEKFKEE